MLRPSLNDGRLSRPISDQTSAESGSVATIIEYNGITERLACEKFTLKASVVRKTVEALKVRRSVST